MRGSGVPRSLDPQVDRTFNRSRGRVPLKHHRYQQGRRGQNRPSYQGPSGGVPHPTQREEDSDADESWWAEDALLETINQVQNTLEHRRIIREPRRFDCQNETEGLGSVAIRCQFLFVASLTRAIYLNTPSGDVAERLKAAVC